MTTNDILIVGDSITAWSTYPMKNRQPGWTVDGVFGRVVQELEEIVPTYVRVHGSPKAIVVALGTNTWGLWTKSGYEKVRRITDPDTKVFYVTTYRRDESWAGSLENMSKYSTWMKEIALENANTFVIDWRDRAARFPQILDADGVHPTALGTEMWADMVSEAVSKRL